MSTHISVINYIQNFSNILLSRLTPYVDKLHGGHQCAFQRKTSTTGHIICIHQIVEKKKGNTTQQNKLFRDFKNSKHADRMKVLYNILNEAGIPTKLVRLIEMRFNATHNKVCTGKHLLHFQPRMVGNKATVYRH